MVKGRNGAAALPRRVPVLGILPRLLADPAALHDAIAGEDDVRDDAGRFGTSRAEGGIWIELRARGAGMRGALRDAAS